jgi:hypothetical protein
MMTRLTIGASVLTILAFIPSARPLDWAANVAAQTPSAQGSQAASDMQDMMKMHEQMMAEMKAAGSRLDALIADMNTAKGDAKLNAVAAVVTELVRQQKSMHNRMGEMHQQMMGGRGMMMMMMKK